MTRPATVAPVERRLLNGKRAAAYIGVGHSTFKALVKADAENGGRDFVKVKIGASVLYDRADLDAYVESRKART